MEQPLVGQRVSWIELLCRAELREGRGPLALGLEHLGELEVGEERVRLGLDRVRPERSRALPGPRQRALALASRPAATSTISATAMPARGSRAWLARRSSRAQTRPQHQHRQHDEQIAVGHRSVIARGC